MIFTCSHAIRKKIWHYIIGLDFCTEFGYPVLMLFLLPNVVRNSHLYAHEQDYDVLGKALMALGFSFTHMTKAKLDLSNEINMAATLLRI